MRDPKPHIESRPELGVVFDTGRFGSPSDGVAEGFEVTGWWDFPQGGFRCWVEDGMQLVEIEEGAATNGDAGIQRNFGAAPGDVYRLTATVRVVRKTGRFKARINISARAPKGRQIAEFNDRVRRATDAPVERSVEAVIPEGTAYVSVRVKFHTSQPGESGAGEIHAMRLERLA